MVFCKYGVNWITLFYHVVFFMPFAQTPFELLNFFNWNFFITLKKIIVWLIEWFVLERQKLRSIVQLLFFVFILRTNGNQMPAWCSYKHSEIVLPISQYAVKIIIALSIFHWFLKELLTYYLKEPPYNRIKMKCRFETSTISISAVKFTLLFKTKARKMSSMSCVCHSLLLDVRWM